MVRELVHRRTDMNGWEGGTGDAYLSIFLIPISSCSPRTRSIFGGSAHHLLILSVRSDRLQRLDPHPSTSGRHRDVADPCQAFWLSAATRVSGGFIKFSLGGYAVYLERKRYGRPRRWERVWTPQGILHGCQIGGRGLRPEPTVPTSSQLH